MASKAGAANSKVKAGAVNLTVGTIIKVNCLATDGTHEYYDAIVTKTEGGMTSLLFVDDKKEVNMELKHTNKRDATDKVSYIIYILQLKLKAKSKGSSLSSAPHFRFSKSFLSSCSFIRRTFQLVFISF